MSDIDRATAKIFTDEVRSFAEKFASGVLSAVANAKPPCSGGDHTPWTEAIIKVLREMGCDPKEKRDAYAWLLDLVWWSKKDGEEEMVLAVESELDKNVGEIEEDFEKLPSFKCQRKLLVFSVADPNDTKVMAESYLQRFTQHCAGEQYVLIGFTASGPRCYLYGVPNDGKQDKVKFTELSLRTTP